MAGSVIVDRSERVATSPAGAAILDYSTVLRVHYQLILYREVVSQARLSYPCESLACETNREAGECGMASAPFETVAS